MPPQGPRQGHDDSRAQISMLERDDLISDRSSSNRSGVPVISHMFFFIKRDLETRNSLFLVKGLL
jgi:hypothetical protein